MHVKRSCPVRIWAFVLSHTTQDNDRKKANGENTANSSVIHLPSWYYPRTKVLIILYLDNGLVGKSSRVSTQIQ